MKGFENMQHAEKRNELTIQGIFILVAMLICLLSTAAFALAAEGEPTASASPPETLVTPEGIEQYLTEHAKIPSDVRNLMRTEFATLQG